MTSIKQEKESSKAAGHLAVFSLSWRWASAIRRGWYKILESTALITLGIGSGCLAHSASAMGGTWLFTITSNSPTIVLLTANLQQQGNQVTGQATITENNTSCGTTATISGSLQGNTLNLEIVQLQSDLFLVGTVNQTFTQASGTYTSSGTGDCFQSGESGSWSAFFGQGG